MASNFRDILQSRRKGGDNILTAVLMSEVELLRERTDLRNVLFKKGSLLSSLFPKVSGYKAGSSAKNINETSRVSQMQNSEAIDKLDEISDAIKIVAKNSMALPVMMRDTNVMKQGIIKLVKLQGGTQRDKSDRFFLKASERESLYESEIGRSRNQSKFVQNKKTKSESGGLLSSLFGSIFGAGTSLISGIGSVVKGLFSGLGSIALAGFSLISSLAGMGITGLIAALIAVPFLKELFGKTNFEAFGNALKGVLDSVKKFFGFEGEESVSRQVTTKLDELFDTDAFTSFLTKLEDGWDIVFGSIKGTFEYVGMLFSAMVQDMQAAFYNFLDEWGAMIAAGAGAALLGPSLGRAGGGGGGGRAGGKTPRDAKGRFTKPSAAGRAMGWAKGFAGGRGRAIAELAIGAAAAGAASAGAYDYFTNSKSELEGELDQSQKDAASALEAIRDSQEKGYGKDIIEIYKKQYEDAMERQKQISIQLKKRQGGNVDALLGRGGAAYSESLQRNIDAQRQARTQERSLRAARQRQKALGNPDWQTYMPPTRTNVSGNGSISGGRPVSQTPNSPSQLYSENFRPYTGAENITGRYNAYIHSDGTPARFPTERRPVSKEFDDMTWQAAEKVGKALGVDPAIIQYQWAIESGQGKSQLAKQYNNFGGIEKGSWTGPTVEMTENGTGKRKVYRRYSSLNEFADDYIAMMKRSFPGVIGSGNDVDRFRNGLKSGRYGSYAEDMSNYMPFTTDNPAARSAEDISSVSSNMSPKVNGSALNSMSGNWLGVMASLGGSGNVVNNTQVNVPQNGSTGGGGTVAQASVADWDFMSLLFNRTT